MYVYEVEREKIFTEQGQRDFLCILRATHRLLHEAGAARMAEIMRAGSVGGDSWFQLACVDRLAELGEIREITGKDTPGQYRVFVKRGNYERETMQAPAGRVAQETNRMAIPD